MRLRDERQSTLLLCTTVLFMLTMFVGVLCVFTQSPRQGASYHSDQARFYQKHYNQLSAIEYEPIKILKLAEASIIQALAYYPYEAKNWEFLALIAQRNRHYDIAHKARRFSHFLSTEPRTESVITVASYTERIKH